MDHAAVAVCSDGMWWIRTHDTSLHGMQTLLPSLKNSNPLPTDFPLEGLTRESGSHPSYAICFNI